MPHTTCAMRNCKSSSRLNKDLKFHRFPREEDRCKLWVENCRTSGLFGRTCESLKNSHLCSLHFEKKMYKNTLKETAVPTLLLPPKESICTQMDAMDTILNQTDLNCPDFQIEQNCYESAGASSQMSDYIGDDAAMDSRWRNGYRCSSCAGPIGPKFRYACVQCPNFELCGACEARGEHAAHYVLRIPPCRPLEEIEAVLRKMRGELPLATTNVMIELEVEPHQAEVDPLTTQAPDCADLDALRKIKTEELEEFIQEQGLPPAGSDERPGWFTDHILPDSPARKPAQVTSKARARPHRPHAHTSMTDIPIKQEPHNDFPAYAPHAPHAPRAPQADISMTDVPIKQEIEIDIPLELNDPSPDNQVVPAVKRKRESLKTLRLEAKLVGGSADTAPMSGGRSPKEHTRAGKKKKV